MLSCISLQVYLFASSTDSLIGLSATYVICKELLLWFYLTTEVRDRDLYFPSEKIKNTFIYGNDLCRKFLKIVVFLL